MLPRKPLILSPKKALFLIRISLLNAAIATPIATAKVYESFADVAERALPGVVNIRTTTYKAKKDPTLDLYQFFLKGAVPQGMETHSVGSGVIVDAAGHILTNRHVIDDANFVEILFRNKKKLRATVVGVDVKTDLALLEVKLPPGTAPATLGDSDSLRVGDVVLAIGNPFGYGHTVTSGIISAKGRVIGQGPFDDFLQTDASIHPGNSGGPLIDVRGRVIGINTAVASDGPGIGFAIPINLARNVMRDLLRFGKVKRPFLGVVGKNILSVDDIDVGSTGGIYGVIAQNLIVEGPAHKAGLKIGDLIMGIDGDKVTDLSHLARLMSAKEPGQKLRLKVYRRGQGFLSVQFKLEEAPKSADLPIEKDLF